jgi:hypothetical protein
MYLLSPKMRMCLARLFASRIVLVLDLRTLLTIGAFPASKEVENEDYWGGYLCRAKHLRNGEGFRVR